MIYRTRGELSNHYTTDAGFFPESYINRVRRNTTNNILVH
jgi:hypothetical protein